MVKAAATATAVAARASDRAQRGTAPPDDAALVSACIAGDQQSWELLINRHAGLIYGVAGRYGLSEADRADVFQTVCLHLWRSLKQIKDPHTLPGWLVTVTGRTAWRAVLERRRAEGTGEDEETIARTPDAGLTPEERLLLQERWASLGRAVRSLDDRCRRLVLALFFDPVEPSYDRIAQCLCIPKGSIGPTRSRCLAKLRLLLESEA